MTHVYADIFSYNLNFTVPAETTPERLVSIPGGALVVADIALVAGNYYSSKASRTIHGQPLMSRPILERPSTYHAAKTQY